VNKTETETALSMVTKAGVPSNKIMVGVSSYGRSFKMVDPSCTGLLCKFSGSPKISNAEPGECTATSGYIADAEIASLFENAEIDGSGGVKTWFDDASDSNIMTWNGNWVAYMDGFTKFTRTKWVKDLNFGGTSDWAVDLQEYRDGVDDDDDSDSDIPSVEDANCIQIYANLDALVADLDNVAGVCAAEYAVGTMGALLDETLKKYDDIKKDYDGKFGYYASWIDELVNPQLEVRISIFFIYPVVFSSCRS
jgi:chitinase